MMPTAQQWLHALKLRTFKELDHEHGLAKGSAFKAFKALVASMIEGVDFHSCDSRAAPDDFAMLMASGRLYPSTVNAVFLTLSGRTVISARMATAAGP